MLKLDEATQLKMITDIKVILREKGISEDDINDYIAILEGDNWRHTLSKLWELNEKYNDAILKETKCN